MNSIPAYRLHRPSGLGVVTLNGRDIYLGRHGLPESQGAYDRAIAEWLARGRTAPPPRDLTVAQIVERYRAERGRAPVTDQAFAHVLALYGPTQAREFSAERLRAVRAAMIAARLARTNINRLITSICGLFRFAVGWELVGGQLWADLRGVPALVAGRCTARESVSVKPVSLEHVNAVLLRVAEPIAAMIGLQLLTGMRPGEVVILRGCDLEAGGDVWIYRPARHKTAHLGHLRAVLLGPEARKILAPHLKPDLSAYLFPPPPRGRAKVNPRYTVATYRQAISRGCIAAGVPHWHPHQLRHTAATAFRAKFGIETAQALLGHRSLSATQIYAEKNEAMARRVALECG